MPAGSVCVRRLHAVSVLGCLAATLAIAGCSARGVSVGTSATEPAKATVTAFLEAIKRGDDTAARAMLTKVARAKTEELGISVAPPVASSATYTIRESEVVGDAADIVHISTTWTDTDADGFTTTEDIIWAVRLDPEGWRVAGMATKIFEDMPPLLLNFEDPDDMIAKQEMVAQELQRRAQQQAAAEATKPGEPRTATGPADGQRK